MQTTTADTYKGYPYEIFEEDGYYHWRIDFGDHESVSTYAPHGDPDFGGKRTLGQCKQSLKSYINNLIRKGF